MKSQTLAVGVLGAVGTVSAGYYAAMDVDTWCLTYISTYLVPVFVSSGSLLPTTRKSDAPVTEGSLEPTSGRSTSTQTTTDTDIASTSVTSLIVPKTLQTSILSSIGSGSSAVTFDTTISTLTNEPSISLDPTTSTDTIPTSTSGVGIDEPAGRIVIFQIVVPDNGKRDLNKRATNGFVGNDNPGVCTFATTFNLAEGQLFDGGVPIFYSGEDFKELSGQGSPTIDAITTTFADSGQRLLFRNSGLPNGKASFCQNSNGLIYIVFTTGPSDCVPVNLAVYGVEQCQNGRLVGVDELTSTTGIANSEKASPETTRSATNTESVVNSQSTGTTQATAPTETSSESLGKSTTTGQTESVESSPDTASPETTTTVSSDAVDSSGSLSSIVTTQAVPETSATDVSALPNTGDDTSTEGGPLSSITTTGPAMESSATSFDTPDDTNTAGESVSSSITTEPVSETSTTEVSTSSEESSSIESTESASFTSTSIESEDSTTGSSPPQTSETTSEILADATSSATTETTQAGTTANAPAPDETSSTEIADIDDTTTANPEIPTTTEGDTVPDTTTLPLGTTTTAGTNPCSLVNNPYGAFGGKEFMIQCDSSWTSSSTFQSISDVSFETCMDECSLNSDCEAVRHFISSNLCLLLDFAGGIDDNQQSNVAYLDLGE